MQKIRNPVCASFFEVANLTKLTRCHSFTFDSSAQKTSCVDTQISIEYMCYSSAAGSQRGLPARRCYSNNRGFFRLERGCHDAQIFSVDFFAAFSLHHTQLRSGLPWPG